MKYIFGIDVGGTTIKFGKFLDEQLIESFQVKTLENHNDPVNSICDTIFSEIDNHITPDDEIMGIGIGIPGPVVDGVVLGAENILWNKVNLKEILQNKYPNSIIVILNDANAATLGEWYYGNGKKACNMVLVTLGTGVGGGIIINNELINGTKGSAGEIGHIKIFPFEGRKCSCGLNGCLEQYTSAKGIGKTAYGLIHNGKTMLQKYQKINVKEIFECAYYGDKISLQIIDKTAYYLAIGLANIATTINPDIILIGGGISKSGDLLIKNVRKHFKDVAYFSVKDTEIQYAFLQNEAGIYGCLYSILKEIKK